jgi:hypothetical protein
MGGEGTSHEGDDAGFRAVSRDDCDVRVGVVFVALLVVVLGIGLHLYTSLRIYYVWIELINSWFIMQLILTKAICPPILFPITKINIPIHFIFFYSSSFSYLSFYSPAQPPPQSSSKRHSSCP